MEGSKETNPDVDFAQLYERIMIELMQFLPKMSLAPADSFSDAETVVLDSSFGSKVSKHVIIRLGRCMFANNLICGAVMRNFQHHLLHRYGPPDTNPFFIFPEAKAKSKAKMCFMDFAVYTKNRVFRLIGSCKRKGCASANPIRWLWMDGRPGVLTAEIFLNALVQRTTRPIDLLITRVVDTINGGVPTSSSLRTAEPASVTRAKQPRLIDSRGFESGLSQTKAAENRIQLISNKIAEWIQNGSAFANYFRGCDSNRFVAKLEEWNGEFIVKINFPEVRYCQVRQRIAGSATHKSNAIYFVAFLASGKVHQLCASNTCAPGGRREFIKVQAVLPQ
jgi:hypothetical protein